MAGVPDGRKGPCIPHNNTCMDTRVLRPHLNNTGNTTDDRAMRKHPPPTIAVCNECNTHCIQSAVSLVFFVGVIANLLVIFLVIKDMSLQKPTFVAIAGLALADMMFLSINLVMSVEELLVVFQCVEIITNTVYVEMAVSLLWKNATFNVVFLAMVRYIILAHPFKARNHLTNKRILVSIVAIMVVACIYNGCSRLAFDMTHATRKALQIREVVDWFMSYLLPLCVTSVLHILKVLSVRISLKKTRARLSAIPRESSSNDRRRNVIGDMATAIAFVLAAELILPLPKFIIFCLREWTVIFSYFNKTTERVVTGIADLLYFVTFTINPFIYAFKSPLFQTSMRSQLCRRR